MSLQLSRLSLPASHPSQGEGQKPWTSFLFSKWFQVFCPDVGLKTKANQTKREILELPSKEETLFLDQRHSLVFREHHYMQ